MAADENNHKNEARDDWTGCTFRVERGPSSEGRAWGMAEIMTDVARRARDHVAPTKCPRAGVRGPHRGSLDQRRDVTRRWRLRRGTTPRARLATTAFTPRSSGRRASRATSWASSRSSPSNGERARRLFIRSGGHSARSTQERHGGLLPRGRDEPGVPLAGRKLGLAPGRVKARCARSTASRSSYAILGVRGTLLTILRGFRTGRLRNPAFGFCGLLPGSDEAQINTERFLTLSDVAVS